MEIQVEVASSSDRQVTLKATINSHECDIRTDGQGYQYRDADHPEWFPPDGFGLTHRSLLAHMWHITGGQPAMTEAQREDFNQDQLDQVRSLLEHRFHRFADGNSRVVTHAGQEFLVERSYSGYTVLLLTDYHAFCEIALSPGAPPGFTGTRSGEAIRYIEDLPRLYYEADAVSFQQALAAACQRILDQEYVHGIFKRLPAEIPTA